MSAGTSPEQYLYTLLTLLRALYAEYAAEFLSAPYGLARLKVSNGTVCNRFQTNNRDDVCPLQAETFRITHQQGALRTPCSLQRRSMISIVHKTIGSIPHHHLAVEAVSATWLSESKIKTIPLMSHKG